MTRVLITGGTGFIGHHLVKYILDYTDWEIVTLDRIDVSSSLGRLTDVLQVSSYKRVTFVYHDLKAEINSLINNRIGDIHYIFHIAASSHVDRSITDPLGFMYDNAIGTTNLLNWARFLPNLKIFFNFSTDEVFGSTPDGVFFNEDTHHNPSNPYAASKSSADQIGRAFYVTYNVPIITTYTVNVFGERQFTEKFVSKAIKAILNDETLTIHGKKNDSGFDIGKRSWIDVKNVCEALLFLVEHGTIGENYNISTIEELDNLEMANIVSSILKKNFVYELTDYHDIRPGYDRRYALNNEKLKSIGWSAAPIQQGLERVILWMAEHPEWL